jgi:hypothetical protein
LALPRSPTLSLSLSDAGSAVFRLEKTIECISV